MVECRMRAYIYITHDDETNKQRNKINAQTICWLTFMVLCRTKQLHTYLTQKRTTTEISIAYITYFCVDVLEERIE